MTWLQNTSARTKLIFSFLIVCSILSGVSIFALFKMNVINQTIRTAYNEQLLPISALGKVQLAATNVRRAGNASALSIEKSERQKDLDAVSEARKDFATFYEGVVVPVATAPEEKALTVKIKEHFAKYCEMAEQLTKLAMNDNAAGMKELSTEFNDAGNLLIAELDEETKLNEGYAN